MGVGIVDWDLEVTADAMRVFPTRTAELSIITI